MTSRPLFVLLVCRQVELEVEVPPLLSGTHFTVETVKCSSRSDIVPPNERIKQSTTIGNTHFDRARNCEMNFYSGFSTFQVSSAIVGPSDCFSSLCPSARVGTLPYISKR